MLRKWLQFALASALSAFCAPEIALAAEAAAQKFPIQYAMLLESGDPISGAATCTIGRGCRIFESAPPALDLSIKIFEEHGYLVSVLDLRCPQGCSFSNGRARVRFRDERQFDVYRGVEGIEVPLVLKPREKIGRIVLIYP